MKQPDIDIQRELNALANAKPEVITIPYTRRKVKIGWIKSDTVRAINDILLSKKSGSKYECQVSSRFAALLVLNGYWKIKLFYPLLWRWYHYIRQYTDYQLLPIITCGKKKAVPIPSWLIMTYLHGFSDTLATMTRKEMEDASHRAHSSGKEES